MYWLVIENIQEHVLNIFIQIFYLGQAHPRRLDKMKYRWDHNWKKLFFQSCEDFKLVLFNFAVLLPCGSVGIIRAVWVLPEGSLQINHRFTPRQYLHRPQFQKAIPLRLWLGGQQSCAKTLTMPPEVTRYQPMLDLCYNRCPIFKSI